MRLVAFSAIALLTVIVSQQAFAAVADDQEEAIPVAVEKRKALDLARAVYEGREDTAARMIDSGVNVNAEVNGTTPLFEIVKNISYDFTNRERDLNLLQKMLSEGADPNKKGNNAFTPLQYLLLRFQADSTRLDLTPELQRHLDDMHDAIWILEKHGGV